MDKQTNGQMNGVSPWILVLYNRDHHQMHGRKEVGKGIFRTRVFSFIHIGSEETCWASWEELILGSQKTPQKDRRVLVA